MATKNIIPGRYHRFAADPEPAGPPAVTEGVVNLGAQQAQDRAHIPHTRIRYDLRFAITEASSAVPLRSAELKVSHPQAANYIAVNASVRGNPVYFRLAGETAWVLLGGLYYPVADIIASPGVGTLVYTFPTRRNVVIACVLYPPAFAPTYNDMATMAIGYIPDVVERVLEGDE